MLRNESKPRDAHDRLLRVPRCRDVLEDDIELAALTGGEGWASRYDHRSRFAQRDLVHIVGKRDRNFDAAKRTRSSIDQIGGQRRDLLVNEILSAGQCDIFNVKGSCVGLLGGAEREMRFLRPCSRRRLPARGEIKRAHNNDRSGECENQGEIESAARRLRRIGNLDLRLFVHESISKFRTFRCGDGKFQGSLFRDLSWVRADRSNASAADDEAVNQRIGQFRRAHA